MNDLSISLCRAIEDVKTVYHRLVLLVAPSGAGKTQILQNVANQYGVSVINVNLTVSTALLDLTVKQRSLRLPAILNEIVNEAKSPVVLDNLEILFDRSIQQDPLRLLQRLSRNRTVVASWNGTTNSGRLFYAEPGHPEYRSYDSVDAVTVGMDGKATAYSTNNSQKTEQA